MIQVIEFPNENRLLLDSNSTKIKVTSTNGSGYYFRAKIYIDDVLFDEQSWSREDNFTATKDLIKLYYSYFETAFNATFVSGLTEQTDLIKKVDITIQEYILDTDILDTSLDLPTFYIMYNVKSENFDDTTKIKVLGLEPEVLRISSTGKVVIPFYINANDEAVKVECILDDTNIIDSQTLTGITGKKVYLYQFDLASNIAYANLFFKIVISVGNDSVERIYKIIRNPHFEIKEIVFKNNFGYYIPVYFDGEFQNESGFKVETYEGFENQDIVFAVEETATYEINTGSLLINENKIINQIANSLECFFNNGSQYLPINTNQKKQLNTKDKQHLYDSTLAFYFKKGLPLDNNGFVNAPELTNLSITDDENVTFNLTKAFFETAYTNELPPARIRFPQLPLLGTLKVVLLNTEVYDVYSNIHYILADVDYFTFVSEPNDSGTPYTTCLFEISNGFIFSESAVLTININDVADVNLPPNIQPNTQELFSFFMPTVGSGSLEITGVTVSDPETDAVTLLWSLPENPTGFSITDETTFTPVVSADQTATTGVSYILRLTATDSNTNESTQDYLIVANESFVGISVSENSINGTQTTYDVALNRGIEGETIDIEFDYDVYSQDKYIAVDSDNIANETLISVLNRKQVFTKTFDASGEINFQFTIEDGGTSRENVTIKIQNPSGLVVVDKSNEEVTV